MTDQLLPGESVNERHLFMPCRHDDVERIMKNNVYVSRLVVPNQFGPGHYFTSNASLCFRWCTEDHTQSRFLLVCQVLLGTYTQGSPNTTARPRRHDSRFYDSLVDNITEPTVFVVADVDQCYPAFIVDFSYTPTATRDQGDTIGNFQTRDDNPPFVTRRREESLSSPTIPTYPYFPDSIGQATENHPVSNLDYASQHLPSTAGTASVSDPHRGVASDPTLAFNTHHLDDSVKAPPPYSERPVNSAVSVPSRPPPSYSESTQRPVSGYPRQPTTGYPLQHTSSYPQQPASGYPQQHASVYPQQHASGYPQQHASGYPHPTNSREVPVQATERRNQTATGKKDDCVVM